MEALPGVDMIIGCNGMIWITHFGSLQSSTDDPTHMRPELTLQDHDNISRASNAVRALALLHLTISPTSVCAACMVCTAALHSIMRMQSNITWYAELAAAVQACNGF